MKIGRQSLLYVRFTCTAWIPSLLVNKSTQECFGMIPWVREYIKFLPERNKADVTWIRKFSKDTLEQRMKEGPRMKDLLYNLVCCLFMIDLLVE